MVSIDQLRTLVSVHESGSFSRAAKVMYLSQPAVSQRVRALEDELGVLLFDREQQGTQVQLTDAGEEVLRFAVSTSEAFQSLKERLQSEATGTRTISIATGGFYVATYVLPRVLPALLGARSDLHLKLIDLPFERLNDSALNGTVDVIIQTKGMLDERLHPSPLLTDELILVGHPARVQQMGTDYQGRCKLPLILPPSTTEAYQFGLNWARSQGFQPEIVVESHRIETLKSAAASNLGFAILPELTVREELHRGELERVERPGLPLQRAIVMACSTTTAQDPLVRAVLRLFADVGATLGPARTDPPTALPPAIAGID